MCLGLKHKTQYLIDNKLIIVEVINDGDKKFVDPSNQKFQIYTNSFLEHDQSNHVEILIEDEETN